MSGIFKKYTEFHSKKQEVIEEMNLERQFEFSNKLSFLNDSNLELYWKTDTAHYNRQNNHNPKQEQESIDHLTFQCSRFYLIITTKQKHYLS